MRGTNLANEFRKAFKGVDQAIKVGTSRALNRALASTKTKYVRALREDTSLKTEVITSRTRFKKAKANDLSVIMAIAIKFGIALSKFNPSLRSVSKNKRKYQGVTAKVGTAGRQLIPGAFALDTSNGLVVVGRKGAFDEKGQYVHPSAPDHPIATLKSNVFTESAKAHESENKKAIVDTFDSIVGAAIDFAIQQKFNDNK